MCNIVVIDLYNNTVEFCSGNQLLDNNAKFDSPLILYTTGSHFQSGFPKLTMQNFPSTPHSGSSTLWRKCSCSPYEFVG